MGYEIKLIIGKSGHSGAEVERDMSKPYSDGSGYEYKKDARGNDVLTGRTEHYFQVMAEIDLCKIGYEDSALNRLNTKSHDTKRRAKQVYYFYGTDGNTQISEDRYGARLYPVPVKDVLKAIQADPDKDYRRFKWAIGLLSAMADDSEGLEVLFYGH